MIPVPADTTHLLPPKRTPGGSPYRITVVCLGNICRSPIARTVLAEKLARAGLEGRAEVTSSGTGGWHVGEPMDRRAAAVLAAHGYDGSQHRASQLEAPSILEHDLVLAMDESNHADIGELLRAAGRLQTCQDPGEHTVADTDRLRMFRDFDPRAVGGDRDVPDPYYGGDDGFAHVLSTVERTADAIVAALEQELGAG
jgi:protein-tyrosine phosphatase